MSVANYVSIALMLGLFGGVLFFLFRRRSRWSKIAVGTPAVLQPRAEPTSASLPSTLNDGPPRPSRFQEPPQRRESVPNVPVPAPRISPSSPIVELHFMPETDATTGPQPLAAPVTEADVLEERKDWPASA